MIAVIRHQRIIRYCHQPQVDYFSAGRPRGLADASRQLPSAISGEWFYQCIALNDWINVAIRVAGGLPMRDILAS